MGWRPEQIDARVDKRAPFTAAGAAFSRRFTDRVGQPPLTYLTAWRMTLAARRLRGGRCPLSVVASEIGYQSEAAFSRAFKGHHGLSPAAYWKQHTA